ncbi:hypothetical protein HanIR_Chr07g0327921 [Helianthus annuus]|nr:hypothetical protein HanIR_Chr07g0327921 [Helianthus annuus]
MNGSVGLEGFKCSQLPSHTHMKVLRVFRLPRVANEQNTEYIKSRNMLGHNWASAKWFGPAKHLFRQGMCDETHICFVVVNLARYICSVELIREGYTRLS